MKKTLLQKAKEARTQLNYQRESTPEMIELAIAWLNGEITTGQANTALKGVGHKASKKQTNTLFQLCVAIREAIKAKKLSVKLLK